MKEAGIRIEDCCYKNADGMPTDKAAFELSLYYWYSGVWEFKEQHRALHNEIMLGLMRGRREDSEP
jgi:hypothetical protein